MVDLLNHKILSIIRVIKGLTLPLSVLLSFISFNSHSYASQESTLLSELNPIQLEAALSGEVAHTVILTEEKLKEINERFIEGQSPKNLYTFPDSSSSVENYLTLKNEDQFGGNKIGVSFWIKSEDQGSGILSYATPNSFNEWIIYKPESLTIYKGPHIINTKVNLADNLWHHVSITWSGESGTLIVYVDGENLYEGSFALNNQINPGGVLIVGNEQDSFGGGFTDSEAFNGEILDLQIFNDYLSYEQLELLYNQYFEEIVEIPVEEPKVEEVIAPVPVVEDRTVGESRVGDVKGVTSQFEVLDSKYDEKSDTFNIKGKAEVQHQLVVTTESGEVVFTDNLNGDWDIQIPDLKQRLGSGVYVLNLSALSADGGNSFVQSIKLEIPSSKISSSIIFFSILTVSLLLIAGFLYIKRLTIQKLIQSVKNREIKSEVLLLPEKSGVIEKGGEIAMCRVEENVVEPASVEVIVKVPNPVKEIAEDQIISSAPPEVKSEEGKAEPVKEDKTILSPSAEADMRDIVEELQEGAKVEIVQMERSESYFSLDDYVAYLIGSKQETGKNESLDDLKLVSEDEESDDRTLNPSEKHKIRLWGNIEEDDQSGQITKISPFLSGKRKII